MKLNSYLNKYKLEINKLVPYGFIYEDNCYLLKKDINESLYVLFKLNKNEFDCEVYNKDDDSLYIPFNVISNNGSYVSLVREIVDKMIIDIIDNCFIKDKMIDKIYSLVKDKYGIDVVYLWEKDNVTGVLRNSKNKWFCIYMEIPYEKLGIKIDGIASIINVKTKPLDIDKLVDNKSYFLAYHMNKKHWITILLDRNIDINEVMTMIDNSYKLVL